MSDIVDLEKLFHRSKDRINDLGEVFTPESYVEDMLNLMAKDKRNLWSDEDTTRRQGDYVMYFYYSRSISGLFASQRVVEGEEKRQ